MTASESVLNVWRLQYQHLETGMEARKRHSATRLPHSVITRAPGLLPMLYRPRELAEDLGVPIASVKSWLKQGAPHQGDGRGHRWINGREFAEWVSNTSQARRSDSRSMKDDEAFCFRCRKPVQLRDPERSVNGRQALLTSQCPECGSTINRGCRNDQS